MNKLIISLLCTIIVYFNLPGAEVRYVGGDISLYPTNKEAGAQYKDQNGKDIELLDYLSEVGMNAMRVRLFVDPDLYPGEQDNNACQDLPYIIPLCQDITEKGFDLMLDFHYSDTWADPSSQWIPERWKGLSDAVLADSVYNYTKNSLLVLKAKGVTPKFIQPGNEISYGMLWGSYGNDIPGNHVYVNSSDASWQRLGTFLKSAISACREVCPDAQIVIHTERASNVSVLTNFYNKMASMEIDYDIIGLSYYPYFHGKMSVLENALNTLESRFLDMPIMIVETGFPYQYEVPGTDHDVDYNYSQAGQNKFATELVDLLLSHPNVNGLFWWWPEYNAYPLSTTGMTGWYNAPLFNSNTGRATPALKTIASFGTGPTLVNSIESHEPSTDDKWYDINGRIIGRPTQSGFYIHNGNKILIK